MLQGYKPVFDTAAELAKGFSDFENFRSYPELFHFIVAPPYMLSPDQEALSRAKLISPEVYEKFIAKGPSYGEHLDAVESRHILIMTFLQSQIGNNWGNVLEIGGGYGNWTRLAHGVIDYSAWSIIDIPHVIELQKVLLKDTPKVHFNQANAPIKVAIGAHSMSEFAMPDFIWYLTMLLALESEYFLYVAHNTSPDPPLLSEKLRLLDFIFDLVQSMRYEDGNCTIYLGKRRHSFGW